MRSIAEECNAQANHQRWLQYWNQAEPTGEQPLPGYKDCYNCPLRRQTEGEDERRSICEACPWSDASKYPDSPSARFFLIEDLAGMPDYYLALHAHELDESIHRDIHTYRQYREDAKLAMLMGARLV